MRIRWRSSSTGRRSSGARCAGTTCHGSAGSPRSPSCSRASATPTTHAVRSTPGSTACTSRRMAAGRRMAAFRRSTSCRRSSRPSMGARRCSSTPGVRTGSDVVKAVGLGASAVGIGRPYVYGAALGGTDGIVHVLRSVLAEADLLMAVDGYPDDRIAPRGRPPRLRRRASWSISSAHERPDFVYSARLVSGLRGPRRPALVGRHPVERSPPAAGAGIRSAAEPPRVARLSGAVAGVPATGVSGLRPAAIPGLRGLSAADPRRCVSGLQRVDSARRSRAPVGTALRRELR